MNISNLNKGNLTAKRYLLAGLIASVMLLPATREAHGFSSFQEFSEKHSMRNVNCAMCHTSSDGPTGDQDGQIGTLTAQESNDLNMARAAMEPGSTVENPILNRFGNDIVHRLGMQKVFACMQSPAELASALGTKSDLDKDGIPDSQEFLDGTDPLNPDHGDPVLLLQNNLKRHWRDVLLAFFAIFLIDAGFMRILKSQSIQSTPPKSLADYRPWDDFKSFPEFKP